MAPDGSRIFATAGADGPAAAAFTASRSSESSSTSRAPASAVGKQYW